jgi:hypothetical protein
VGRLERECQRKRVRTVAVSGCTRQRARTASSVLRRLARGRCSILRTSLGARFSTQAAVFYMVHRRRSR